MGNKLKIFIYSLYVQIYMYIFFVLVRWSDMSNLPECINYVQDSSSDTETDYKETDGRGRHRIYKNRLR